jgi:hypothetical protein
VLTQYRRSRIAHFFLLWRRKHPPYSGETPHDEFLRWARYAPVCNGLSSAQLESVWIENVEPVTREPGSTPATEQNDMFRRAHARSTDPGTSHAAAKSLSSDRIRASQQEVLHLFSDFGPMHDQQLVKRAWEQGAKQSSSGLRTRRHELVVLGKLVDSQRRVTLPSGRKSIVWELR